MSASTDFAGEIGSEPVAAACRCLKQVWNQTPQLGIILGTGSGGVAQRLRVEATIDYEQIPGFVRSTATGHQSRVICGWLGSVPTIAMQGRFHRYEGWTFDQMVFPTRVLAAMGIRALAVTNAAGGVDPTMQVGDLILIDSHIDLLSYWPGDRGPYPATDRLASAATLDVLQQQVTLNHVDPLWRQRPLVRSDQAYDARWRGLAQAVANRLGVAARCGVYVALPGPNYETRAEYRMVRRMGGDVVGMSTVPEIAVAALHRLPVLAISIVTNVARPDALAKTSGEEVVHAARDVESALATIIQDSTTAFLSPQGC